MRSIIKTAFLLPTGLGLMFVLYALLARQLSPADYGVLNLVFSIASLVGVLLCAGLPIAATKFIPEYIAGNNRRYISGYLKWGTQWVVVVSCLVALFFYVLGQSIVVEGEKDFLLYLSMTIPSIMLWQWQRYSSLGFDLVSTAIVPRDILFPLCGIVSIFLVGNIALLDVFVFLNAIYISSVLLGFYMLHRQLPVGVSVVKGDTSPYLKWHKTAFPMVLTTLVQLGLSNWDIILLGALTTMEDTGLYAVASRAAMLVSLILRVLETTVIQKISKLFAEKKYQKMQSLYNKTMMLSSVVGVGSFIILLLFMGEILSMFGNHYQNASNVVIIIALGHLVSSCIGPSMSSLNMIGYEKYVAKLMVVWSALAVVLYCVLISLYGVYGAAIAFSISLVGMKLQQYVKLRAVFKGLLRA